MASGLGDDGQAAANSLGAVVFLSKPFGPDDMVAAVDEALAISTALGMHPLMERVLSRREILNA